jgi:hypothetical protein
MLARMMLSLVALTFSAALFYAALIYLPQREAGRAAAQQAAAAVAQDEATQRARREAVWVERLKIARETQREAERLAAQREVARAAQEKFIYIQECRRAALALHKQHGDTATNDYQHYEQMEPMYVYSLDEKRCIYKGGFTSKNSIYAYLMDMTNNELLAEYIRVNGKVTHGDMDRFIEVFGRYFFTPSHR